MKVFYDRRMSVHENDSFSPSAGKPELLFKAWKKSGVPFSSSSFKPLTRAQISVAHDAKYVEGVLTGDVPNGFGNHSNKIAASLPWTTGAMTAAALHAFKTGEVSFCGASGFHHSHFDYSGGFCTFDGNVIAAILAHEAGAKCIGIIDVDRHPADGTDSIIKRLKLDFIKLWSFGMSDITRTNADKWLKSFPKTLFGFEVCDLWLINGGVDAHVDDPLGGILTTEQMKLRDHYIFSTAKALGIPVAVSTAGGYIKDNRGGIAPTLALHVNTLQEAFNVNR